MISRYSRDYLPSVTPSWVGPWRPLATPPALRRSLVPGLSSGVELSPSLLLAGLAIFVLPKIFESIGNAVVAARRK
jgi:hypothetical protein